MFGFEREQFVEQRVEVGIWQFWFVVVVPISVVANEVSQLGESLDDFRFGST